MISETMTPIASVPAPNWTPDNKEAGRVDALLPQGPRCFVGGNFTEPKPYVFAARSDGTVGNFDPGVAGRVYDLAWDRVFKILYTAGSDGCWTHRNDGSWLKLRDGHYRSVGLLGRTPVFGSENGMVFFGDAWSVGTAGSARDLVVTDTTIYVAGGQGNTITKLDASTGDVMPWASKPGIPVLDLALSPDGLTLYAALGGPGGTVAAYDTETGQRKWFHMTDGNCQAVCVLADGTVVVGMHGDNVALLVNKKIGEYASGGRVARKKVFALDPDGNLLDWKVNLTSNASPLGVWALAASPTMLYVGGDFTSVNGVDHPRTAAFAYSV